MPQFQNCTPVPTCLLGNAFIDADDRRTDFLLVGKLPQNEAGMDSGVPMISKVKDLWQISVSGLRQLRQWQGLQHLRRESREVIFHTFVFRCSSSDAGRHEARGSTVSHRQL